MVWMISDLLGNGMTIDEYLEAIGEVFDEEGPAYCGANHQHTTHLVEDEEDD